MSKHYIIVYDDPDAYTRGRKIAEFRDYELAEDFYDKHKFANPILYDCRKVK